MFDFLIALIGGIIFILILSGEGIRKTAYNYENSLRDKKDKEFHDKVVADSELSFLLYRKIQLGENADEIYDELKDDLAFIYGDNLAGKFLIPKKPLYYSSKSQLMDNSINLARDLLLSHQGKVEYNRYVWGFPLGGKYTTYDVDTRIYQCIEKHLQENGINTRFVLQPEMAPITDEPDFSPYGKKVIFEHQLYKTFSPNDRRIRLW